MVKPGRIAVINRLMLGQGLRLALRVWFGGCRKVSIIYTSSKRYVTRSIEEV